MSCNCNAKYDNKIPCCCVTTEEPVICTTTTCADAQPCNISAESDCVIYNKDHECVGISSGDTITSVVDIILGELNLIDCTTTVPSTCNCYLVINNDNSPKDFSYNSCGEESGNIILTLEPNQRIYVCSSTIPELEQDSKIKIGTINDLTCTGVRANCNNPDSYCHQIVVNTGGPLTFQYIDIDGILQNTGSLTVDGLYNFCGWEGSFDKLTGVGTYTLTKSDVTCTGSCIE